MRVWRTLKQSGAAVLRDGVYLLPDVRQGYDTFLSTCQAIRAEGGTGYVFTIEAAEEEALRPLFDRREQYDALLQDLQALQGTLSNDELAAQLKQLRKIQRDYRRIEAIDFFPGPPGSKPLSDWPLSSRSLISGYRRTSRSRWRAN
ncbi:hypothetical protein LNO89_29400 [Klebsiella pneumoniae subsp. pneumoniae]|nr:hypothetical protein [Klebsiella pneumoniae subsp. pneumoniae]